MKIKILSRQTVIDDSLTDASADSAVLNGGSDVITVENEFPAEVSHKGDTTVISYFDPDEKAESEISFLKTAPHKVTVRRRFEGKSEIVFEKGRIFEGVYETPFGNIDLCVFTEELSNTVSPRGVGSISIRYECELRGCDVQLIELDMKLFEE